MQNVFDARSADAVYMWWGMLCCPGLTSLKAITLMLLSMRWLRISRSTFLSICNKRTLLQVRESCCMC
jgi:hypothetical protein